MTGFIFNLIHKFNNFLFRVWDLLTRLYYIIYINNEDHQQKFFFGSDGIDGVIGFSKFMMGPMLDLKEELKSLLTLVLFVGLKEELKLYLAPGLPF